MYLLMVQFLKNKVVYYFGCVGSRCSKGLSLLAVSRLALTVVASPVEQALGTWGFSSCSSWAQYLRCTGLVALQHVKSLHGLGLNLKISALAWILTTGPPGKPLWLGLPSTLFPCSGLAFLLQG